jgi:hypothetical protein
MFPGGNSTPTRLSIKRLRPCWVGASAFSCLENTVNSTEKTSRHLSAFDGLHRRINPHIRSKVTDTGHLKTTSAAIPSQIPSTVCQSDLGRGWKAIIITQGSSGASCTACCSRGGRNTVATRREAAAHARRACSGRSSTRPPGFALFRRDTLIPTQVQSALCA